MREPIGVIHGRFQILHNDHLKYLLAGKERCEHLVVGITNPDPTLSCPDCTDEARSRPENNPLTYLERLWLVERALLDAGVPRSEFTVVPLPINQPKLFRYYVPLDALFFLTIYDKWGEKKLSMFEMKGLRCEVMWRRSSEEKGIFAAEVRKRMRRGEPWQHMVPDGVGQLLEELGIVGRLKEMAKAGDLT